MAKGTYTVGEGGEAASTRDASFKSCLCALLVFIAICTIILLAGIKWSKDTNEDEKKTGKEEAELLSGDREKTTQANEKLISKTIPTTSSIKTTSAATTTTIKQPNAIPTPTPKPETVAETTTSQVPIKPNVPPVTVPTTTPVEKDNETTPTRTPTPPFHINIDEQPNTTSPIVSQNETTIFEEVDQTTVPYQDNTTTLNPNNNETQKPFTPIVENSSSTTTQSPIINTTQTEENLENVTSTVVPVHVDVREVETNTSSDLNSTTNLSNNNQTEEVPTTTEDELLHYKTLKIVESTGGNTTEETTTANPLLSSIPNVTQTASTTEDLNTATETAIATTTEITKSKIIKDEGQKSAEYSYEEYETGEITSNKTTTTNRTPEKHNKTDELRSWHDRMSTTTASPLKFNKSEPVCPTVGCKSAASRMLSLMDHSVDPCEDFYEFSCGGMQVDNVDSDTWKRLSEQLYLINKTAPPYLQTFKNFYDSCVSHEYKFDYETRITGVLKLVKDVGEIFDSDPELLNKTLDMTDLFAKLILRQSLPIMDIDIDIDKQTSKFILKLTLPKPTSVLKESGRWSALTEPQKRCLDIHRHELQQLNVNLNEIYESFLKCQKDLSIYLNSIETVVKTLGFYSHLNDSSIVKQHIQVVKFAIEFQILYSLNELPQLSNIRKQILLKDYTIQKISGLQLHYPFLDWTRLFNTVTGHNLDNNTLIQLYFPTYFASLFETLQERPKWEINDALIAMYAHNLYENLVIPQAKQTRENYCIKLSSKVFPDISSNLYMKTWPKSEIKDSQEFLTRIFKLLKRNLTTALMEADWLDDETRTPAVFKLNQINLTFNKQADLFNNETDLNIKYNNVTLKSEDFQYNAVIMLETDRRKRYALQGELYSTDYLWSYFINAFDSTPTSFYSQGLIMAPLGMVKQPVKGFPGYVTMARLGLSLAREIGRHFDPVGVQNGMTLSSTSNDSYYAMQEIMENDSLFKVTRFVGRQAVSFSVDPTLSVNERIADNTGFRLISDSFDSLGDNFLLPWISSSFSREKIFFVTAAQSYCQITDTPEYMLQLFESEILPASLRVENIMTNSDQFSEAFKCSNGSTMNNNPMKMQFPHLQSDTDYNYYTTLN